MAAAELVVSARRPGVEADGVPAVGCWGVDTDGVSSDAGTCVGIGTNVAGAGVGAAGVAAGAGVGCYATIASAVVNA